MAQFSPIDALRRVGPQTPEDASALFPDTSGKLYLAKEQEKGGLEDALAQATRSGDQNWAKAIAGLMGSTERDIQDTGVEQANKGLDQQRADEKAAVMGGFGGGVNNPRGIDPLQAKAQYGQTMDLKKLLMPLEQTQVQAQGNVAAQRVQSQGALDVENARNAGNAQLQQGQQDYARQAAQGAQAQNGQILTGFNKYGPQFRGVPNTGEAKQAEQQIFAARAKGNQAAVDQGVANWMAARGDISPEVKQWALAAANSPRNSSMSFDQVLTRDGENNLTPAEQAAIRDIFNIVRGH